MSDTDATLGVVLRKLEDLERKIDDRVGALEVIIRGCDEKPEDGLLVRVRDTQVQAHQTRTSVRRIRRVFVKQNVFNRLGAVEADIKNVKKVFWTILLAAAGGAGLSIWSLLSGGLAH